MNRIVIPLDNGCKLIAEQNSDSEYNKELFIGIESDTGIYLQDLAIVRPTYTFEDNTVKFSSDEFNILVFGNENQEDYTEEFTVPLRIDEE